MSGSGELPFTGSIFTLPLIVIGLTLTLAGWILRRFTREPTG
jgi:LPXTG-motif cell wall-anchored protein